MSPTHLEVGPVQKRTDLTSSLVLIALGIGWVVYSMQYPMGSLALPGPGLLPLVAGVVLILLSTQLLVSSLPVAAVVGKKTAVVAAEGGVHSYGGPLVLLGAAVVYLATLEWSGYLINTFLIVLLGIRTMGGRDWVVALLVAVGTTVATYLMFAIFLNMPLPPGQLIPLPFGER